jgi:hemin uptake protein HemP
MAADSDSTAAVQAHAPRTQDLAHPSTAALRATPRPRIPSTDILRDGNEVEIDHRGTLYRLRITSLGKLILTK